ncbi:MAG: T9SS type A sorting domain-containing protein [Vicingaceae bacterium]|nr:T9SS type A sorting domain-containing protein [Vicingaceae bacterium]
MKTFFTKAIIFFGMFFLSLSLFAQVQIDSIIVTNETCSGDCDGTLTIFTSGGTAPLLFDIGGTPQASNVFTGLCATIYNVTVSDALPSSDVVTATITSPSPLVFTISTVDASAYGLCDGTADVTINGGTPPYTITYYAPDGITILQSDTSTSIDSLCAATYFVKVTDANSCPPNGSGSPGLTAFAIAQPSPPPLVVTQTYIFEDCLCPTSYNSSTLNASGGVPPYTYSWGSPSITGICVNDYIPAWIVTDDIGQQQSGGISMLYNQPYVSATINNQETCAGVCDGEITVVIITPGNGFPPYEYSIDGGGTWQPSPIFSGLCPATYQFTTRDSRFCYGSTYSTSSGYTIQSKTPLTYTLATSNNSVNAACDGAANVTINGGTPPYTITYFASNATTILQTGTSTSFTGLCAGTYYVEVTDMNNCSSTGPIGTGLNMFTITQPPPVLLVNQVFQMPHCNLNCDGSTQLIVSGGVPPYVYSWGTTNLGNLCDGDTVPSWSVTDSIGQQVSGNPLFMVANQPQLDSIIINDENCAGACDGEIQFNIVGGDPPYFYSIDSGVTVQSNPIFSNLCPGNYTLQYSDSFGCGSNLLFTINAATPIFASVSSILNINCIGECMGSATIDITGGSPPYSFLWDDPLAQTTATATNLCAGTYTCDITDSNGCDTTVNVVINEPLGDTLTAIVALVSNPTSIGACDGIANGSVTGGTAPYAFLWIGCPPTVSPNITTPIANSLCDGEYQVIITDANGCIDSSDCITIIDPPNNINENTNTIINKIYPNPTGGLVTIEFSDKALLPLTLEVIDVKGKIVKNYSLTDKNSTIDLTTLLKGAYILSNTKLSIHKTIILE